MASTFLSVLAVLAAVFNSGIIQAVVKAVEQIYKGATGVEKKEAAMKMLVPLVPASGFPVIKEAIDAQVEAFNNEGVFTHKAWVAPGDPGGSVAGPVAVDPPRKKQ